MCRRLQLGDRESMYEGHGIRSRERQTAKLPTRNLEQALICLLRREKGQTMAEYAVILSIIVIAIVLAIAALSVGIANAINAVVPLL